MPEINLPPGYILCKKGGRPKKDARNIAVLMARQVRTERHGELAKISNQWILDHWTKNSASTADNAINEDAHIRRSMRAASDLLNKHIITIDDTFAMAIKLPIVNGTKGWFWCEGLTEAQRIEVTDVNITTHQEVMRMNPTAIAARQLFL